MAKAEKGEQKANLYLLAIVAIVALVGIVVLVLNSSGVSVSDDLTGQAARSGPISIQQRVLCEQELGACSGGWYYSGGQCVCRDEGRSVSTSGGAATTETADSTWGCGEHQTCMLPYHCVAGYCVRD